MHTQGTDLAQAIAIGVSANDALQNPESVGNMLKTISLRLNGATASDLEAQGLSSEGMSQGTTKSIVKLFKNMAGIDIFNGTQHRSMYDILDELYDKWDKLTDMQKTVVTEAIGGKRGGSIVSSMMTNWQDTRDAYLTAQNSQGSAKKEQKNREKSIQFKLNQAKSQIEEAIANAVDKGLVTSLISGFNTILSIVTKITAVFKSWSLIPLTGIFVLFERFATGGASGLKKDFDTIKNLVNSIKTKTTASNASETVKDTAQTAQNVSQTVNNATQGTEDVALTSANMAQAASEKAKAEAIKEVNAETEENIMLSGAETAQDAEDTAGNLAQAASEKAVTDELKEQNGEITENIAKSTAETSQDVVDSVTNTAEAVTNSADKIGQETTEVVAKTSKLGSVFGKVGQVIGGFFTFGLGKVSIFLNPITVAIAAFSALAITAKKIRDAEEESFDQMAKNIENSTDKIKNAQKTVRDLQSGNYDELRNGVNTATNENKYLSEDEYKKYLDYNNQIAELSPQLVAGYDAQGNAIIKYGNNIKDTTDILADFVKEQIKAKDGFMNSAKTGIDEAQKYYNGNTGTASSKFAQFMYQTFAFGQTDNETAQYLTQLRNMKPSERKDAFTLKPFWERDWRDNVKILNARFHYKVDKNKVKDTDYLNDKIGDATENLDQAKSSFEALLNAENEANRSYYDMTDAQKAFLSTINSSMSDKTVKKIAGLDDWDAQKKLKSIANDNFDMATKLQKVQVKNSNGKKNTLLDSLMGFTDEAKQETVEQVDNYYERVNDELIKQVGAEKASILEEKLGITDKHGNDLSAQYQKKVDNVLSRIHFDNKNDKNIFADLLNSQQSLSEIDAFLDTVANTAGGINSTAEAYNALTAASIKAASQASTNVLAYDNEKTAIANLQQAINDASGTNGLSQEDIDNVEKLFQTLNGYDPSKLFIQTANGLSLNEEEFGKLNKQYEKNRMSEINDALKEQYNALDGVQAMIGKNEAEIQNLNGADENRINQLDTLNDQYENERKQIEENINKLEEQRSMYQGLISDYAQWQNALNTSNQGAISDSIASQWDSMSKLAKQYRFGTDDMRSFVTMMTGEDVMTADVSKVIEGWNSLQKNIEGTSFKLKDFYTEGAQGSVKFLTAMNQLNKKWAWQDKNGAWHLNADSENVAEKMGVGQSAIDALFAKLEEFGFKNENTKRKKYKVNDHTYDYLQDDGTKIHKVIDVTVTGNSDIAQMDQNLDDVEKTINDINNSHIDPKTNTANLKRLRQDFNTIVQYRAKASAQKDFHVDTSKLSKSGQKAFQQLTVYYTTRYAYKESQKTSDKTLKAQARKKLQAQKKEIENAIKKDPTIADELNIPLTVHGKVNWKEMGKKVDDKSYIDKLTEKLEGNKNITVTVKTNQGEVKATNKDLKTVSKNIKKIQDNDHVSVSVTPNEITFNAANRQLASIYDAIRDIRANSHTEITVTETTIKKTKDEGGSKSKKENKKTSDKGAKGGDSSRNISGMTKSEGQNNKSYADGKKVEQSPKTKGKSLVGELGTELLVRNGHYQTIGDNGAEMIDVQPTDIIFNHEQTKELLENGSINSRGFSFAKGKKWWGSNHKKLDNYGKHKVVHQPKQKAEFIGNVDINKRPIVQNGEDTYSTTITAWQGAWRGSEENGHYIIGHFATILEDGTILSNDEAERYMSEVLNAKNPWSYDKKHWKLLYKIDNVPKSVQSEKQLYNKKSKWYKKADKYDINLHNYQDKKQRKYAEQAGFVGKAHADGYNGNDDILYDLLNEEIDDDEEDISDSFATGKRNHLHGYSYARGKSLVGELGAELLVRNGHYQTIGDNGAEMIDVQPNDIIFNHEQTKQLLENGKINSRGKSYADGTDYDIDDLIDDLDVDDDDEEGLSFAQGNAYLHGYSASPIKLPSIKSKSKKRKKKNTTTKRRSNSNRSRSNKNRSNRSSRKSSSDWSDVAVEEPTNFDWIEVRLNRINDDITQLDYNVNRTYLRWGVRHKALNGEIAKTEKLILNAGKGATKYLNKAKSVEKNVRKTFKKIKQEHTDSNGKSQKRRKYSDKDLDKMTKQFKEYAKKVREGKLQIQDIKNPDMAKAIQDYQTWYEKYRSARDQVQQAIDKRHDLRMQRLEQANEIRESRENLYETRRTGVNNREDFLETHGLQTNDSIEDWYHQNYDERKKKRTQMKKEIADDKKEREKMIDDALGVTSADEDKAYKKAVSDKKKRNTRLKKAFGTNDLDRIKAEHNRIIKKKNSGKKLTKRENKKLKSYNNNYKKAKSDTATISNYKTRKKALDYVNLDKSEKKKYTNAQNDKKIRNQRLKKAFGTTNIKKIQNEYDKLQAKKDSGKKLTKKENKKLKSYKNNFKPLQKDDKTIQKVRSDVAKTSKDIIDADEKIASKENNLNQDRQESVNDYFDMLEKKMTAIETKYSNLNVQAEGALSRIDSIIQLSQSKGYLLSGKFYDEQIKYQKAEGENIKGQLQESLELLKQYPEGTKEYYDAYSKVVDLGNQDLQNQAKEAQLEKEKADLEWTKIERKHTYIGYLNEELGWLESILETDHKITDAQTGRFNEYGVSALATYAKQYDTYMVEADEWAKDVQKVKAELDKDPDNTELQDKYQQYMQNWRSTITSAETAKKSMSNLMKQQYDAELAALKTVLDYRKKELEAQKSIYQYQKDITEKSRSVESIEKQLMAFQNDTSEEGKARTEKLKDQLRTAKQSLQDTEYNQYVSDQEELLDNLYTEFQNMFEDKMDDLEQVVKDAIKIVNDNQSTEVRTIDKVAKDVGYKVTDGTKNILNSQSHYYTNTVPGEFETLNTTISSEVKNITDAITSSETASEKILNDNIDKLITKMPDPQKVLDLENMVIKDKDKDNDNGENGEAGTDNAGGNDNSGSGSGNSNGGGKKPQKKQIGDYKEYFSKTGKYTNYDDKINESRRERVRKAVDNSNTKDSNKKAKKGSLEYFLYHNYGAGNTKNDLVNYWNAIHGDHKKTKKDKLSSAEKKDLMNWFKAFYSDGGTIGKAIKMSGEDGMILAKTGEEVLSIEKVKELQKALALLQPIHGELNQIHNIPTRTLNDNSVGDVSIVFNMPNVSNYEDFAKKLKSDTNMQKYIQQITIGEALGQNSLLKKKF